MTVKKIKVMIDVGRREPNVHNKRPTVKRTQDRKNVYSMTVIEHGFFFFNSH